MIEQDSLPESGEESADLIIGSTIVASLYLRLVVAGVILLVPVSYTHLTLPTIYYV